MISDKLNLNKDTIISWAKLISITGGTQIIIQAISLVAGIATIRLLSIEEYAWFTLANTILGSLAVLSDGGITSGVMAEAGKNWQNKAQVGIAMATGAFLRKRFAIISLIVTLPLLCYLLYDNNAAWWQIILINAAIIPSFYASLSDTLLQIPVKLNQDIIALQKNQLYASILRIVLTLGSLLLLPFTAVALVANGLPRIWANYKLQKVTDVYSDKEAKKDDEIQKNIMRIVKRSMPGAIYYVLAGQITIWILSFFGSTDSIAQVGALGRIVMVFSLLSTLNATLIAPRFARLPADKEKLMKRFSQIQVLGFVFSVLIFLITCLVPTQLLWILGDEYAGLETELLIFIAVNLVGLLTGINFTLCTSRGWVLHPVLNIGIPVASLMLGVFLFDLTSLKEVLYLSALQTGVTFILLISYGYIKISKLENNSNIKPAV